MALKSHPNKAELLDFDWEMCHLRGDPGLLFGEHALSGKRQEAGPDRNFLLDNINGFPQKVLLVPLGKKHPHQKQAWWVW